MGIAAVRRGDAVLRRPFEEASKHAAWVDNQMRGMMIAERAVEYCRNVNSQLAEISSHKGIRLAWKQAHLNCHVGQVRRSKYLDACTAWRDAKPGQPEWVAAYEMRKAAEWLMKWVDGES